jgi:hypothetical protein
MIIACAVLLLIQFDDPFSSPREKMVKEQIEGRGIRDKNILRVMRATPRHLFVPAALRLQAYEDYPLPIGYSATVSQPFIVAWMTELLQLAAAHRVLEMEPAPDISPPCSQALRTRSTQSRSCRNWHTLPPNG